MSSFPSRFVVLPENRLAVHSVRRLFHQPLHSQLFLHGPSGSGKTALAEWLEQKLAGLSGERLSARQWAMPIQVSSFAQPIGKATRTSDWIILEDISFLPMEASSRLEHWLDQRRQRRLRTLITSNTAPAALNISERLLGRLLNGVVVGIQVLSLGSRVKLLRKFCKRERLYLTDRALHWLSNQSDSPRAILGQVRRLQMIAQQVPPPIDQSHLESLWNEPGAPSTEWTMERITQRVAEHFRIPVDELLGSSRQRNTLWPRQLAMYLTRQETKLSLVEIGNYFGGRDHSTVLHAIDKVRLTLIQTPKWEEELRMLTSFK